LGAFGGLGLLVSVDSVQDVGQVSGGEGFGRCILAGLEAGEALLDHVEVREVVGRERFSLDDGDRDKVQPRRMGWGVHHDRVGELLGEPVDGLLSPMGQAVVDHPRTRGPRMRTAPGS
jgi:hypothetical protein